MRKIYNFFRQLVKTAFTVGSSEDSYQKYREFLDVHRTAIIDSSSSVTIFNLPKDKKYSLKIGEYSHIFARFSLVRSNASIIIGKRCQLGAVYFNCAKSIQIGDDVLMAWGITVIDNDSHSLNWRYRKDDVLRCYQDYKKDQSNFIKNKNWSQVKCKSVVIGNKAWIGLNAIILKGVHIGEASVVGAGSVVTQDIPPHSLVAGNPARIVKKLSYR